MKSLLALVALLLAVSPAWAVSVVIGSYTTPGSPVDDTNITISPACQPKAVLVKREGVNNSMILTDTMATNAAGEFSGNTQSVANAIQQLNSDGFQIGTAATVNAASTTYRYMALCDNGANDFATVTYTGNAADNRAISLGVSWTPELVIIIGITGDTNAWRGETAHGGADLASRLNEAQTEAANYIQSVAAGSFTVGTAMNVNTGVYHALAFKGNATGVATGNFAGNTSDDRDIAVTTFTPEFALVRSAAATNATGTYRFSSNSGDASFCTAAAAAANQIQTFGTNNFQVGTAACANENGQTMRWFALADVAASGGMRARKQVRF